MYTTRRFCSNFGYNHPPGSRPFIPQRFRALRHKAISDMGGEKPGNKEDGREKRNSLPVGLSVQEYLLNKCEVAQVRAMKKAKLMYVRDTNHNVTAYSYADGSFIKLTLQKYDYCSGMEAIEYDSGSDQSKLEVSHVFR